MVKKTKKQLIRKILNAIYPINNVKIEKNKRYIGVYNEFFFNNEQVYFERNRIYGGIGYQINGRLTIQTGVLKNFLNVGTMTVFRNFYRLSMTYKY